MGNSAKIETQVRLATEADVSKICSVLVRSVREVCASDYNNDSEILDEWCANKTPENILTWLRNPQNYFIVAEIEPHGVVGAGMLKRNESSIYLCYLVPEGLHRGVGKKLLQMMEDEARRGGSTEIILGSTVTARNFYLRNGYRDDGPATYWGKILGYPMRKTL